MLQDGGEYMDMFKNERGLQNRDIVSLVDGRVAILFDELDDGAVFMADIFLDNGVTEMGPVYDEEIIECLGTDDFEIARNAIRCNACGDEIESKLPYDDIQCKCKACTIDGGLCYIRRKLRMGASYTELSEIKE